MSKPIVITLPHHLGQAEARQRIEGGFGKMVQQFGNMAKLDERWDGDQMHFAAAAMGQTLKGKLDVLADAVRIEVELPGMLALIADKVREKLTKEGQLMLEKK